MGTALYFCFRRVTHTWAEGFHKEKTHDTAISRVEPRACKSPTMHRAKPLWCEVSKHSVEWRELELSADADALMEVWESRWGLGEKQATAVNLFTSTHLQRIDLGFYYVSCFCLWWTADKLSTCANVSIPRRCFTQLLFEMVSHESDWTKVE